MSSSDIDLRELAKSAIVERVARALCEAEGMNPNNWRHKVKAARAAIEAMMEPTPEVCGAMMDVLMFQGDIYQNENGQIMVESITPKDLLRAALRTSLTGDSK